MGKAKNQHPGQPNSVPSSFANSCVRVCKPHGSRFSDFPHLTAEGRTKAILVSHKNQRSTCCPQLHPSLAPQSAPNRKKSSHRARSIASSKLCIRLSISLCLRSTLTTWTLPPPRHELSYSSTVCRCVHVHMCSEPNKHDAIQPLCFQKRVLVPQSTTYLLTYQKFSSTQEKIKALPTGLTDKQHQLEGNLVNEQAQVISGGTLAWLNTKT